MGLFPLARRDDAGGPAATSGAWVDALENLIADIPAPDARPVGDPAQAADAMARRAAHRAAVLSGSLALPPGPLGMVTVIPDLYLIWKVQRQMVADVFALHGKTAELTRSHMVYCLFRHLASHLVRDVAVRAGQRVVLTEMSAVAMRSTLSTLGLHITRRAAGAAAGRWIPLAGAAAVGAYAYWDTMQVARTARRLLDGGAAEPSPAPASAPAAPADS